MAQLVQVEAIEAALLGGDATLSAVHGAAVHEGQVAVRSLVQRFDDRLARAGTIDGAAFDGEVEATQRAALEAYAREVAHRGVDADAERWRELVDALPASSPQRAMLLEVGVPGAASLLTALDPAALSETPATPAVSLDVALRDAAPRCSCGFASTRSMPSQLCWHCDEAIAQSWLGEERRILARIPALAAEHTAIFDPLLDRLADLWSTPDDTTADGTRHLRKKARRPIARANATHAADIERVGDDEWQRLARLAAHSTRTEQRMTAKRWATTGIGMARLSQLGHDFSPEVKARIAQRTLDGTLGSTMPKPFAWVRRLVGRND